MSPDLFIFTLINNLAGHWKLLDSAGIFFADFLPYALGLFLLVLLLWPKKDLTINRAMVFTAIVAGLVARFVVKGAVVLVWQRPRPFMVLPGAHKLVSALASENFQSFPSGHTIFFFALSAVICKFNKKLGIFFFTASALMGIARIYGGAHWPSDIAWGAVLGTAVGFGVYFLYAKYFQKFDKVP